MIYFLGWVAFLVCVLSAIPIATVLERRKYRPKAAPVEEEQSLEELLESEPEEVVEGELEKRLRRLKLAAEGMSQEEMYAHAQATLALATMLENKERYSDANSAVEILVNQPGIGDHYLILALVKRIVLLKTLGMDEQIPETEEELRNTYMRLQQNEPQVLDMLASELSDSELETYRAIFG
ncbi:hypothetical protein Pla22_03510 [Rubripirellula amarantea]|uniref:Uncharacterized protein n=1 Tax=Rubripirellula amarantea TaxID=2527999 RepID=A0A5C5WR54_9BACT|nr:hypothetical protein [Rubripirellula amarantea]TWT52725.1 hypothetical protein Pla22_03510 [Rubripirellula amarantea]